MHRGEKGIMECWNEYLFKLNFYPINHLSLHLEYLINDIFQEIFQAFFFT